MSGRINQMLGAVAVVISLLAISPPLSNAAPVSERSTPRLDASPSAPELELSVTCEGKELGIVGLETTDGSALQTGVVLKIDSTDDATSRVAVATGESRRLEVRGVPAKPFAYSIEDGPGHSSTAGTSRVECGDGWGNVSYLIRLFSAAAFDRADPALIGHFTDSDGRPRQDSEPVRVVVQLDESLLARDEAGGDAVRALDDFYAALGNGALKIKRSDELFVATMEIDAVAFAQLITNDLVVQISPVEALDFSVPDVSSVINSHRYDGPSLVHLDKTRLDYPGAGVGVAVLDTGIDVRNPDLADSVKSTRCSSSCTSPLDQNGHGTRVGGLISSSGTTTGVVGGAPAVDLHSIKIASATGEVAIDDVFDAFGILLDDPVFARTKWSIPQSLRVVNLSFGSAELFEPGCGSLDAAQSVISNSIDTLSSRGVVFVAAAGNHGRQDRLAFPACLPRVLAVSASEATSAPAVIEQLARWADSNGSSQTTVMAPGVEIAAPSMTGIASVTGTSFAAPLVSACVAAMIDVYPQMAFEQVREVLTSSTGENGALDCDKAVTQAEDRGARVGPIDDQQDVSISERSCTGDAGQLTFTITNNDDFTHRYYFKAAPPHGWDVVLEPGQTAQYTLGGIPLGRQRVYVGRDFDYQIVEDFGTVVFDCGRPAIDIGAPVCREGRGGLAFSLRNDTSEGHRYFFKAGPPHGADIYLEPGEMGVYELHGIRPGVQAVWVALDRDTNIVKRFPAQEFCGATESDDGYTISDPTCVDGNGSITFTIYNADVVGHRFYYKAAPPHGWDVFVGPGETVSQTLAGIPSGPQRVWIARDNPGAITKTFPDQLFCS